MQCRCEQFVEHKVPFPIMPPIAPMAFGGGGASLARCVLRDAAAQACADQAVMA
jgi:hypothetical protein